MCRSIASGITLVSDPDGNLRKESAGFPKKVAASRIRAEVESKLRSQGILDPRPRLFQQAERNDNEKRAGPIERSRTRQSSGSPVAPLVPNSGEFGYSTQRPT